MFVFGFCTCSISCFACSMSPFSGSHFEAGLIASKPGMPSGVQPRRRQLILLRDVVDDLAAVDRERHRAALVHVRDVLDVEAVDVGAEGRVLLVVLGLLDLGDLLGRQVRVDVDLAGLVRLDGRRRVVDHAPVHARERDAVGVAPLLVLDQVDAVVVLPRLELERTVRDDVRGLGPLRAELLDRRPVHGEERRVRGLLDEPRLRGGQLDLQRLVVDRVDPDLLGERVAALLAAVVVLRADDAVELVGVVGGELGRDRPLPRVLEVLGGDRVAVRPRPVGPEVVA